jgi:hypothetical protein
MGARRALASVKEGSPQTCHRHVCFFLVLSFAPKKKCQKESSGLPSFTEAKARRAPILGRLLTMIGLQ